MSSKLIVGIVPKNSAESIYEAAKKAGAGGGTIVLGRGTATNSLVQLLGLGDTSKEIVYIVSENENAANILGAIQNATREKKAHFGCAFTLDVPTFIKSGFVAKPNDTHPQGETMNSPYRMITVIVNKGYAEDAMAAARKAGATGGTIMSARGTAKEGDAQFFGMNIVPEKDMLIILVPSEKKDAILNSVTSLSCFREAGSGIVFCNDVNDFTMLGAK